MERKEKPRRKHKKYRDLKCYCGNKIDIDEMIENEDFDYINKDKSAISIYCPICGESHLVKL